MRHSRLFAIAALGLGLTLALVWILRGPSSLVLARRGSASGPPSLDRQQAPIVITGGLLPHLTGSSLGEIFVYAQRSTTLTQIPFQIDERDENGMYVTAEDNQLDDNDELVFMAIDGGGWVENPSLNASGALISPMYAITITDPISDTHAWAYVFCSSALSRTFSADYVSYDDGNDRITSPDHYAIGFNATDAFQDYLTLGGSNLDLLDRNKVRVTGTALGFPVSVDEEDFTKDGVHAIDGPVRVTRVSTSTLTEMGNPMQGTATLFAYRSLVVQSETIALPGAPVEIAHLRTSVDWNRHGSGMMFYDSNNPAGVTVDGVPDVITTSPAATWTQVTTAAGTIVSVNEVPIGLGGTQSTYYRDNSAVDSSDTGDQRSYGDAGLQVDNPNSGTYAVLGYTYFPTGVTTNVGATYVDYYRHPLQVHVAVIPCRIYLPAVIKN